MTYEELKIQLDLCDPIDVLKFVGKPWYCNLWFVVCDEGDCHLFKNDGTEDDIRKVDSISKHMICKNIKKIVIPDSVTSITGGAFWCCSELLDVTIPDSVTDICDYAFYCCNKLTSVIIPDSVTSMGNFVFKGCSGLTSVTIHDKIKIEYFTTFDIIKSFIFTGKTPNKVKELDDNYPWGIDDVSIIKCV